MQVSTHLAGCIYDELADLFRGLSKACSQPWCTPAGKYVRGKTYESICARDSTLTVRKQLLSAFGSKRHRK
eukprot:6187420-Pleurochrysis_carterae.AAC.2